MKLRMLSFFVVVAMSSFGCGANGGDDPGDDAVAADALVVSTSARVGTISFGQTKSVAVTASPKYRALSFAAKRGDAVRVRVTSDDGDPVAWLTNARFAAIAKNDDASSSDTNATIERTLSADGTYWIVVRDAKSRSATLDVALTKAGVPDGTTPAPSTCASRVGQDVLLTGTCSELYECPIGGKVRWDAFASASFSVVAQGDGRVQLQASGEVNGASHAADLLGAALRNGPTVFVDGPAADMSAYWSGDDVSVTAHRDATGIALSMHATATDGSSPYMNTSSCAYAQRSGLHQATCNLHLDCP